MPTENPNIHGRFDRRKVWTEVSGEGGADQSERGKADINVLAAQYENAGIVPQVDPNRVFADVSNAVDLQAAHDMAMAAREQFMRLDPKVREAAENDEVRFLEMMATEEGQAALEAAGLEIREPEPQPVTVRLEEPPETPSEPAPMAPAMPSPQEGDG